MLTMLLAELAQASVVQLVVLFLCGGALMGATIERTIQANNGKAFSVGFYSTVVSITTWINFQQAATGNCLNFAAFSAGTVVASMIVAWWHKDKNAGQEVQPGVRGRDHAQDGGADQASAHGRDGGDAGPEKHHGDHQW